MVDDNDFCNQLENWYQTIVNKTKLSAKDKAIITGAGAKIYASVLKDETPYNPKIKTTKHLRDSITFTPGKTIDGTGTGDTDVGFDKSKAYIARFLNDGTKKMQATHFRDHALAKARDAVFSAEALAYKKLVEGGGKDDNGAKGKDNH